MNSLARTLNRISRIRGTRFTGTVSTLKLYGVWVIDWWRGLWAAVRGRRYRCVKQVETPPWTVDMSYGYFEQSKWYRQETWEHVEF